MTDDMSCIRVGEEPTLSLTEVKLLDSELLVLPQGPYTQQKISVCLVLLLGLSAVFLCTFSVFRLGVGSGGRGA